MIKTALKYILVLAVITAVSCGVFLKAEQVYSARYSGALETASAREEEASYLIPIGGGQAAVLGRYAAGSKIGQHFYRIYDRNGRRLSEDFFYVEGASLSISQVLTSDADVRIVCTVTPHSDEEAAYGAVYTLGKDGKVGKVVEYRGEEADSIYGFDRFISTDEVGTYFAGIYHQRVVLFDAAGAAVLRLTPGLTLYVSDVHSTKDGFILAGCTSEIGQMGTVHRAFCAAYDMQGAERWRSNVMGEQGIPASVLRIEEGQAGEWILYGRYADARAAGDDSTDTTAEAVTPTQRVEAFKLYEGALRFHIGATGSQNLSSAVFLLRISDAGEILDRIAYTGESDTVVPSMDFRPEGRAEMVLQAYTAERAGADRYTVTRVLLTELLRETVRVKIPVSGDTAALCASDSEGGNEGLWIYSTVSDRGITKMEYFTTSEAAAKYFSRISRYWMVCELGLDLKRGVPLLLSLYGIMTICAMGVHRRGKQKA